MLVIALTLSACARAPRPEIAPAPTTTSAAAAVWPAARPLPQRIEYPAGFQRAIESGTRTADGRPGARYWQQWAEYDVAVTVDPAAKRLEGTTRIVYHNRSPRPLPQL
ncbi:MAG TPA: hypothetical protein VEA38_01390 [Terriglobales bacterium]|nr:hypothetical protein [Terriglobales bacterium]